MKNVEFNNEELQQMRSFYEKELYELVSKFEHVKNILNKLGYKTNIALSNHRPSEIENQLYVNGITATPLTKEPKHRGRKKIQDRMQKNKKDIQKLAEYDKDVKEYIDIMNDSSIPVIKFNTSIPLSKREKKSVTEIKMENYRRNKNILWSNYVYDVIKLTGYPLTVDEIQDRSIKDLNLNNAEKESAASAIHSSLFRLKRNQKSINNYAIKGSRTSYYGLTDWYTQDGKLLKKYMRPE